MAKYLNILFGFLLFSTSVFAETVTGFPKIIDGDTISLKGKSIEMAGYYAPRLQDQCALWKGKQGIQRGVKPDYIEKMGVTARKHLQGLIGKSKLTCNIFNESIGLCLVNGKPVYEYMLKAGLGWERLNESYNNHSANIEKLFRQAKKEKVGVHSFSYCKNPAVFHRIDNRHSTKLKIRKQIDEGKKTILVK